MTKLRAPLTFENALTKVAGHIGWPRVALICGQAERTVRNWSEPDTTAAITLEAALQLDKSFHIAGGDGTPFLYCYATRLEAEKMAASPELAALIASAAQSARETGEAVEAMLGAASPTATRADFAIARREIEESLVALNNALAVLMAREKAMVEAEGEEQQAEPARAQGVAPTMTTA